MLYLNIIRFGDLGHIHPSKWSDANGNDVHKQSNAGYEWICYTAQQKQVRIKDKNKYEILKLKQLYCVIIEVN